MESGRERPASRRQVLAALGTALFAGCQSAPPAAGNGDGGGSSPPTTPGDSGSTVPHTEPGRDADWRPAEGSPLAADVRPTTLVKRLEIPWDLSFAPNGEVFVTERTGQVLRFEAGELATVVEPADAIDAGALPPGSEERPWWVRGGEGGTMGVAVHPEYPDEPSVFVYYTAQGGEKHNRLVRYDARADEPSRTATPVLEGVPAGRIHNGGRIRFGPRNYLWVTTGDSGTETLAQDAGSLAGKVLRMTPAGEPAPTNPDLGGNADPRVFTYGHRNPQGLAWLPDGATVATEHGPSGHDELNRLVAGANYGWPEARTRGEYRGTDFQRPLLTTGGGTWAPSGCVFYTGEAVPEWHNRLVLGGLVSQSVWVVTLTPPGAEPPPDGKRFDAAWLDDAYTATAHRVLRDELGRVRLVTQGPDGELYAITSNRDGRAKEGFPRESDDVLVRLDPA